MRYLKVIWVHDNRVDPNLFYYEYDDEGWAVRVINLYPDGTFGLASKLFEFGGTYMPEARVTQGLDDARSKKEFGLYELDQVEFERVWNVLHQRIKDEKAKRGIASD